MKLMIIESPGKVTKLREILGPGWEIAASAGHVRDLPREEVGVHPPNFRPAYEYTPASPIPGQPGRFYPGSKDRVDRIAALVKQADVVYLATDPDREGESISWHLQQCLKLENPLRVTFNEITPHAVKTALASPRSIDVRRVAAQEARRVLDRLVGYMVSPELSLRTAVRLSAGRVQSPAVRLVVERERQISAFRVTNHFGATLFFADEKTGNTWSAEWLTKPNFVTEDNPYFMDRAFAAAVANGVGSVIVKSFTEREAKRSPPAPFTTATLLQASSVALGFDPKMTMETAQKLFESGHITYHRTDNPNVSDESLGDIYGVAVALGLDMADEPRSFKAPEGAQAGHPAITPTHWEVETAGDTKEQQALYKLIRLRAIACQLADARYAVRTVSLSAAHSINGKVVDFEGTGRTLVYSGWLKLLAGDQTEEEDEGNAESTNPIPECQPGAALDVARGSLLERKTKPLGRFTQASLVKKLESEGIGRPATYAAIMDNIVSRAYVETKKKFLYPTSKGELVVDSLIGKFEFVNLGFTRDVEEDLDRIASGEATYKGVIAKVHEQLTNELLQYQNTVAAKFSCPECGKPLRSINGKNGAFWACSGYPECHVSMPDADGAPGKRKVLEVSGFACMKCSKPLIHRVKVAKKGGYDFFGCSGYKDGCSTTYENKDGKPNFDKSK
jgi:DNA topoisomerase-1